MLIFCCTNVHPRRYACPVSRRAVCGLRNESQYAHNTLPLIQKPENTLCWVSYFKVFYKLSFFILVYLGLCFSNSNPNTKHLKSRFIWIFFFFSFSISSNQPKAGFQVFQNCCQHSSEYRMLWSGFEMVPEY